MKTFLFDWKKWTLVILCALNIVIMIVYAALCKLLADRYLYDYETFEPYRTEDAKVLLSLSFGFSFHFNFCLQFYFLLNYQLALCDHYIIGIVHF